MSANCPVVVSVLFPSSAGARFFNADLCVYQNAVSSHFITMTLQQNNSICVSLDLLPIRSKSSGPLNIVRCDFHFMVGAKYLIRESFDTTITFKPILYQHIFQAGLCCRLQGLQLGWSFSFSHGTAQCNLQHHEHQSVGVKDQIRHQVKFYIFSEIHVIFCNRPLSSACRE